MIQRGGSPRNATIHLAQDAKQEVLSFDVWRADDATSGGSAAPDLRETVRALLAKGLLAPVRDTVLAGHGSGKICAVCGLPIAPNDVEYEVEGLPRPTRCHVACFVAWRDESRRVTSPDQ